MPSKLIWRFKMIINPEIIFHVISGDVSKMDAAKLYVSLAEKYPLFGELGSNVEISLIISNDFYAKQNTYGVGIYHVNIAFSRNEFELIHGMGALHGDVPCILAWDTSFDVGAYTFHYTDNSETILNTIIKNRFNNLGSHPIQAAVSKPKVLICHPLADYDVNSEDAIYIGSVNFHSYDKSNGNDVDALNSIISKLSENKVVLDKIVMAGDNAQAYYRIQTAFKNIPCIAVDMVVKRPSVFFDIQELGVPVSSRVLVSEINSYVIPVEKEILNCILDGKKPRWEINGRIFNYRAGGVISARITELWHLFTEGANII